MQERKRFTVYFQPTRRHRPNRLSDGSLSAPPSPLIPDESQKSNLSTPVDSPGSNAAVLLSKDFTRISNLTVCTDEERDEPWPWRTFPLNDTESKNLLAYIPSPSNCSCDTAFSRSISNHKYPLNTTLTSDSPRNTPRHSPTPLTSPGTPNEIDKNWTVKLLNDAQTDVVTSEKLRKGIVLKLAKK